MIVDVVVVCFGFVGEMVNWFGYVVILWIVDIDGIVIVSGVVLCVVCVSWMMLLFDVCMDYWFSVVDGWCGEDF